LTKKRDGLSKSYHGSQDEGQGEDYLVWTEYGADFWLEINRAGFNEIRLYTLENESTIAICAKKNEQRNYLAQKFLFNRFIFILTRKKIKKIWTLRVKDLFQK